MNSFKCAHAIQMKLEFGGFGLWLEWETGEPGENLSEKGESQQQTQPTNGVDSGIWTRATLVGEKCSHHCSTLASPTVA